jgi:arylsulfatase A-like enzyme
MGRGMKARWWIAVVAAGGLGAAGLIEAQIEPGLDLLDRGEELSVHRPGGSSEPADAAIREGRLELRSGEVLETWLAEGAARRVRVAGACRGGPGRVSMELSGAAGGGLWSLEVPCADPLRWSAELPALSEPALFTLTLPAGRELSLERLALEPGEPLPPPRPVVPPGQRRPNLIVFLVDTLRADELGVYGSDRGVTPAMDAFARDGVVFANGFSLAPWTRSAVATLLTGQQPFRHKANVRDSSIDPSVPTLAEMLQPAGYRTEAIVTNGNISAPLGFGRGYADYTYLREDPSQQEIHVRASVVTDEVLARLARLQAAQPFHLYVHVSDPHYPYAPPEPYRKAARSTYEDPGLAVEPERLMRLAAREDFPPDALRYLREMYEGDIASVDAQFGRLIEGLRRAGLYENSAILLTADHGEQFMEHGGLWHAFSFYGELIRVPFVLKLPEGAESGRVVEETVNHLDVVPTLLELSGSERDPALPGASLLALLGGGAVQPRIGLYVLQLDGFSNEGVATDRYLLILNQTGRGWRKGTHRPRLELFDRVADPGELHNLARERPAQVDYLLQQLNGMHRRMVREPTPAPAAKVDPETDKALQALGYVN